MFKSLEDILKDNFGLKGDLCKKTGQYTQKGYIAYEKLIQLIYSLGDIIDIDTENIIKQLDNIEYEQ